MKIMIGLIGMLFTFNITADENGINLSSMSFKDNYFEKIGVGTKQQSIDFKVDSTECLEVAEMEYAKNVKKAKMLSELYGQKMDNKQFEALKNANFIHCMTGFLQADSQGKGWTMNKRT